MMTDYIEVEYNGETVRQWPDGSLRHPNGQLVAQHPLAAPTINQELSAEYNQRRWDEERAQGAERQAESQRAFQRALVSQVPGAKTLDGAVEQLAGGLVAELATDGAVKEHGIKNWVSGTDWALKQAGLIEEKQADNRQVNIENATFMSAGTREHVKGLLQKLAPADGSPSDVDGERQQDT
jgi:hypothetical protein